MHIKAGVSDGIDNLCNWDIGNGDTSSLILIPCGSIKWKLRSCDMNGNIDFNISILCVLTPAKVNDWRWEKSLSEKNARIWSTVSLLDKFKEMICRLISEINDEISICEYVEN